jgi:hypothetical protein
MPSAQRLIFRAVSAAVRLFRCSGSPGIGTAESRKWDWEPCVITLSDYDGARVSGAGGGKGRVSFANAPGPSERFSRVTRP